MCVGCWVDGCMCVCYVDMFPSAGQKISKSGHLGKRSSAGTHTKAKRFKREAGQQTLSTRSRAKGRGRSDRPSRGGKAGSKVRQSRKTHRGRTN